VTFDDFRDYLGDFAWFWPGMAISIVLAIVLGPPIARAFKVRWPVATVLVFSLGLIVSATLTPSREALRFGTVGSGSCDLGRIGIASIADLFGLGDPSFNILLYIPFGLAIGLLPTSRRSIALLVGAVALPFAIETIQMLAVSLDRACQSADVSDNLTGLVIGLVAGVLIRSLGPMVSEEDGSGRAT
jgi:glycopeptide antibiotics resistance protein